MSETISRSHPPASVDEAKECLRLLRSGGLELHFQPIVNLRSGKVYGLEALGRLATGGRIISPKVFLQHFDAPDLLDLLLQSVDQGLAALVACSGTNAGLNLSLNVHPVLLLEPGFASVFLARLADFDLHRITIEILESGEFLNTDLAHTQLTVLRAAGIKVALDDVGSAYSSLMRLRVLPVDKIKLDQVFVRELKDKPEDLVFVSSMMSMARGLGKKLIVEGVETLEILDALRVLGVELAQGYAIGRPMPASALLRWLSAQSPEPATSRPHSLLGAYAAHLCLVEACRALLNQPLKATWISGADNPHACLIGQFLDEHGLHDIRLGLAHKHLHRILPVYSDLPDEWDDAAEKFRRELEQAIQQGMLLRSTSTTSKCGCVAG